VTSLESSLALALQNPQLGLDALDAADAEESLKEFIKQGWHVLEPTQRPFVDGWHIGAICEHLQAVTDGEITRLLINQPPGTMKSMLVQVFWPAWEWGPLNLPHMRYVSASYSQALTVRDNRRCRILMESEWYQKHWGNRFNFAGDQNSKIKYENDKTGFRIATSVGGLSTGERGDRFIIDDPHNVKKGDSEKDRADKALWFDESVTSRTVDPETSSRIIIMQRVHEKDLTGHILAKDNEYEHLMLPMEFEPERKCYTAIFEDPRKNKGELLWPPRYPKHVVERDKRDMGSYATAGQFQQRPAPRGGGKFKRHWFEIVKASPAGGRYVRSWDLAATEDDGTNDPDYTACLLMKVAENGIFYIEHADRMRASSNVVEEAIKNTATQDQSRHGYDLTIRLNQDPGQAGKAQAEYLIRKLAGHTVTAERESGDKEVRANPFASQAEAGNVKLVEGAWNQEYLDELTTFPRGSHDDWVDCSSSAFNFLTSDDAFVGEMPLGGMI